MAGVTSTTDSWLDGQAQAALDAGAEPGSTIYSCPLPTCEWVHIEPPLGEAGNALCLAAVFGPGVFAAHAIRQRLQRTEETLAVHVATHPPAEWVPAMAGLRDRVTHLERELAAGSA